MVRRVGLATGDNRSAVVSVLAQLVGWVQEQVVVVLALLLAYLAVMAAQVFLAVVAALIVPLVLEQTRAAMVVLV